jgi:hypothetical protein
MNHTKARHHLGILKNGAGLFVRLFALGTAALLGASAQAIQNEPPERDFIQYRPSARVQVIPNLTYANYGERKLLLDLYLPLSAFAT